MDSFEFRGGLVVGLVIGFMVGFIVHVILRDHMRKSAIDAGVAHMISVDKYSTQSEFQWITNKPCN
jgi:hypothetical protein